MLNDLCSLNGFYLVQKSPDNGLEKLRLLQMAEMGGARKDRHPRVGESELVFLHGSRIALIRVPADEENGRRYAAQVRHEIEIAQCPGNGELARSHRALYTSGLSRPKASCRLSGQGDSRQTCRA